MRSKEDILYSLEQSYINTPAITERTLMSVNMYLEVLIDIRDTLKDLVRIVAVKSGESDIS